MSEVRSTHAHGSTRRSRWLAAIVLCVAMPGFAADTTPLPHSQAESQGISSARLQRLHDYMRTTTDDNGYLGGVTLVARNGHIVDWQAYGHRDLARREPMHADAIFRIYSMTKTVTSVAVMMLGPAANSAVASSKSHGISPPNTLSLVTSSKPAPINAPKVVISKIARSPNVPSARKSWR